MENGVTVRATEGKNNLIENCLIENTNSNQVLLVNDQMKVLKLRAEGQNKNRTARLKPADENKLQCIKI